jgi:hypothetical protein
VERAIRYLKERFFAARTFHSIEHGNAQLTEFLAAIAHQRPHPRWPDRRVADVFEEERPRLLALPATLPETDSVIPAVVDKTAFIRLDTNRYSVPAVYARRTLAVAVDDRVVRILDGAQEVARHSRCWGRHQVIELRGHREALVAEKRKARDLSVRSANGQARPRSPRNASSRPLSSERSVHDGMADPFGFSLWTSPRHRATLMKRARDRRRSSSRLPRHRMRRTESQSASGGVWATI